MYTSLFRSARLVLLAGFASLSFFSVSQASVVGTTVIGFEGVVANGQSSVCPITSYTEAGYTLTASAAPLCNNFVSNNVSGNNSYGNATAVLGFCTGCNGATVLTLTSVTATPFAFSSIDLGSHYGSDPAALLFTGNFAGGGSISQSVDPTQQWATYAFTGFTGLSSLTITTALTGGHASLDNITLNASAVPEPTSLALVGLALLGAGLARRRAVQAV